MARVGAAVAVGSAAVCAAALVWLGGASPTSAAAGLSGPVVYGYPYASRCPAAGIAKVVDRWEMFACNCTSYVAWALTANGRRTDWFVAGAMDAWNWPNVARLAGLVVDDDPQPGTVAVWPNVAKPFGHVAFVTAVHANRTIDVAEYNFPLFGANTFVFGLRDDVPSAGAVFIHVPRRRGAPQPSSPR